MESARTPSPWLAELRGESVSSSPLPEECDVAIVGAGMTGCSLAFHLQESQRLLGGAPLRVVVIDSRGISGGASGRNGGILWPSGEEPFELRTADALNFFCQTHGADAHFLHGGGVSLVEDPEDDDNEDCLLEGVTSVDPAKCLGARPGAFCRGYLDSRVSSFWPAKVVCAIAEACNPATTTFVLGCTVGMLDSSESCTIVSTTQGDLRCQVAVAATNGWLPRLLPELTPYFRPATNTVLCSDDPILHSAGSSSWGNVAALSCGDGAEEVYLARRDDGRLVIGGLRENGGWSNSGSGCVGDDDTAPGDGPTAEALKAWLADKFPGLASNATFSTVWLGVLGYPIDNSPIAGPLPNWLPGRGSNVDFQGKFPGARLGSVWAVGGYCGHGMPRCFGLAEIVAKQLTGHALDPLSADIAQRFSVSRFFPQQKPGLEQ